MSETLRVLGPRLVGKETLIGILIYKCGLDLRMMEQLQGENRNTYSRLTKYYQLKGIPLSLQTRKHHFVFNDANHPDCAIYMIDASTPAQVLGESGGAADAVSLVDVLKEAKRLIVLINKMDEVSWSEEKYVDLVKAFEAKLKGLGVDLEKYTENPFPEKSQAYPDASE